MRQAPWAATVVRRALSGVVLRRVTPQPPPPVPRPVTPQEVPVLVLVPVLVPVLLALVRVPVLALVRRQTQLQHRVGSMAPRH